MNIVSLPDELPAHLFSFLPADKDRGAVVCRTWYDVERRTRLRVYIRTWHSVSPEMVIRRFPNVRAVKLKGAPPFPHDLWEPLFPFDHLYDHWDPDGWCGDLIPWIKAFAKAYPGLEEIELKRIEVFGDELEKIAMSFQELKVLVIDSCQIGLYAPDSIDAILENCRNLRQLDVRSSTIETDRSSSWPSFRAYFVVLPSWLNWASCIFI